MAAFMKKTSKYIKAYFVLTLLCYVLDLISFFVGVAAFGDDDDHKSYFGTVYLIFAVLCIVTDLYYVIWSLSIYMKLPKELANATAKMTRGAGDQLEATVRAMIAKRRGQQANNGAAA